MDIPHQLVQIYVFLAYDRFISVLEKLSMPFVPPIVRYCISGQQSSHQSGNTRQAASKEKMGMIEYKGPCVALCVGFRQEYRKAFDKIIVIHVIVEYPAALNAPYHNMVQEAGCIEAGCPWHERKV